MPEFDEDCARAAPAATRDTKIKPIANRNIFNLHTVLLPRNSALPTRSRMARKSRSHSVTLCPASVTIVTSTSKIVVNLVEQPLLAVRFRGTRVRRQCHMDCAGGRLFRRTPHEPAHRARPGRGYCHSTEAEIAQDWADCGEGGLGFPIIDSCAMFYSRSANSAVIRPSCSMIEARVLRFKSLLW